MHLLNAPLNERRHLALCHDEFPGLDLAFADQCLSVPFDSIDVHEVVCTDESRIYLQHHDSWVRVWRYREERMLNSCFMHHHTGPAPGIMGLATAIFQQDNVRPHVARIVQRFFVNQQLEFLPWTARSPDLSPIENMWSMVA
ncbi:transposable element Tcb1 transposase [Trichonephila clavipes]|nr:transposable element Tcb1 transposase [Trichonephila clavipes]